MPNTLTCGENESRANVRVMRKEVMDHHYCSKTHGAFTLLRLQVRWCRGYVPGASTIAVGVTKVVIGLLGNRDFVSLSTSSIFIMGLMLCVRFKLDVVTVVLHKDSAL